MNANHLVTGTCCALLVAMSCATAKKTVQATSTVEEMPLEPAPAGAPVAAPAAVAVDSKNLPTSEFKLFTAPAEGFSVMGPSSATLEHPKDESGKEIPFVLTLNGQVGQTAYAFLRQGIPPQARGKIGSSEQVFEQSHTMLTQAVEGTVKSKTPFKYKGFDAEDFVITGVKKQVTGRVVITDSAVFNLFVFYDVAPPPYVKAYLDSLEFTPVTPAATPPSSPKPPSWGGPPGSGTK